MGHLQKVLGYSPRRKSSGVTSPPTPPPKKPFKPLRFASRKSTTPKVVGPVASDDDDDDEPSQDPIFTQVHNFTDQDIDNAEAEASSEIEPLLKKRKLSTELPVRDLVEVDVSILSVERDGMQAKNIPILEATDQDVDSISHLPLTPVETTKPQSSDNADVGRKREEFPAMTESEPRVVVISPQLLSKVSTISKTTSQPSNAVEKAASIAIVIPHQQGNTMNSLLQASDEDKLATELLTSPDSPPRKRNRTSRTPKQPVAKANSRAPQAKKSAKQPKSGKVPGNDTDEYIPTVKSTSIHSERPPSNSAHTHEPVKTSKPRTKGSKSRKGKVAVPSEIDVVFSKAEKVDDEVDEFDGEPDSRVEKVPTRVEFSSWKKFDVTEYDSGTDIVAVRKDDCIYVVDETLPDDKDQEEFWVARVIDIRCDPKTLVQQDNRWVAKENTKVLVYVDACWFYRIEDITSSPQNHGVQQKLRALGFRSKRKSGRCQSKELIRSDHSTIIPVESIAGLADMFRFNDRSCNPDKIFSQLVSEKTKSLTSSEVINEDEVGLKSFYYRLQMPISKSKKQSWNPKLNQHCICLTHYNPTSEMIHCSCKNRWFHTSCLFRSGHFSKRKELTEEISSGEPLQFHVGLETKSLCKTVPPDLLQFSQSSIRRGGFNHTLAGNIWCILEARELVSTIEAETTTKEIDWKDEVGLVAYEASMKACSRDTDDQLFESWNDTQVNEGDCFKCPDCSRWI